MRDPLSELLNALAPVFFAIILGYFAGRKKIIDNRNVEELNSLVMTFAVPAAIFVSIAQATRGQLLTQLPLALILSSTMLILYGFTFWMAKFKFKADSSDASLQALTTSLPNYASAGLPLIMALLGPTRVISVAVAIGCGSIVVSPITLVILHHGTRKTEKGAKNESDSSGILAALKSTLMKPIVFAPIIAVVMILAGVRLPVPIAKSFSLIGEVSGGAGLFLTGVILSAQKMEWGWNASIQTVLSNVVHPLMALGLALLFHVAPIISREAILLAALPTGYFGVLFGVSVKRSSAVAGTTMVASTALSAVTIAAAVYLTSGMGR